MLPVASMAASSSASDPVMIGHQTLADNFIMQIKSTGATRISVLKRMDEEKQYNIEQSLK